MKFKDVAISEASTEAKVAALAVLLDKELLKLAETVLNVKKIEGPKGEQGLQGPKGEQGDRGFDGTNGKDGRDGKDGKDGADGPAGVGVADAHVDFDGSLVIVLTDGREINAGEVVPLDVAEKIKVIGNGGGTSQSVLDAIDAINAIISTYGTMATQNANNVAITGGSINGTTIGGTTPAAGTFTTLTSTGQALFGNSMVQVTPKGSNVGLFEIGPGSYSQEGYIGYTNSSTYAALRFNAKPSTGGAAFAFNTYGTASSAGSPQFLVNHTSSAVNYVQVTGAATGGNTVISAQGSDSNIGITYQGKGAGSSVMKGDGGVFFQNNAGNNLFSVETTASSVNRLTATGSATGFGVRLFTQGSDTNISQVFQSKGTGAIDLAAGSSGVNISNGGTVTALTRTAAGTAYTSAPSVAITAPTTAGGVQATATVTIVPTSTPTITSGGTGYTVNDVLTFVGGTGTATQMTVTAVSGGVITAATATNAGAYSVAPSNPISVTGGTGSGATFTSSSWSINSTFTITNAGSGYVEQPTVSFSGGGGSGAAAYATVGSGTTVKSLGSTIQFATPSGIALSLYDASATVANYVQMQGRAAGAPPLMSVAGSDTNINYLQSSKGTGQVSFYTNGFSQEQFRVAHTASAVNYVQVTGAATGGRPTYSAQGSDAAITLGYAAKGSGGGHIFTTNGNRAFQIDDVASAVNNLVAKGGAVGSAALLAVQGTDTNIDLALTPKGTGRVKFGTYTANMALTVQGYIEILDSGGTVRKLAVIA